MSDKPKKLKILGYHYDVVENEDSGSIEAFGRCQYARQRIMIASDLQPDNRESTLLHEIIEALNYHLELRLEHHVIMGLEVGLYQALVDNGVSLEPLSRYIQKK